MKKTLFIFLALVLIIVGVAYFYMKTPLGPAANLSELEPVVLGLTTTLGAFILETPSPASQTIDAFTHYISESNPRWSYVFTDYSCNLKIRDKDGIFIINDKKDSKLLFEDGNWSSKLDEPHWRIPNHPRLQFPIKTDAAQK